MNSQFQLLSLMHYEWDLFLWFEFIFNENVKIDEILLIYYIRVGYTNPTKRRIAMKTYNISYNEFNQIVSEVCDDMELGISFKEAYLNATADVANKYDDRLVLHVEGAVSKLGYETDPIVNVA